MKKQPFTFKVQLLIIELGLQSLCILILFLMHGCSGISSSELDTKHMHEKQNH